jgi:hypothetical protein
MVVATLFRLLGLLRLLQTSIGVALEQGIEGVRR